MMDATENSKARLKSLVERIERLENEKSELAEDVRMVFKEAKSEGFDVKAMKKVIKLRAMDSEDRIMEEAMLDTYKEALGLSQLDLFKGEK